MKVMYRLWACFSGFVRFCSGVVVVYSYFVSGSSVECVLF